MALLSALALTACSGPPASVTYGSAAPPTPAVVAPVAGAGDVIVRPGDTLYSIARRFAVPQQAIIGANSLASPYVLRPGQRLLVPGAPGGTATNIVQASARAAPSSIIIDGPAPITPVAKPGAVVSQDLAPIPARPAATIEKPKAPPALAALPGAPADKLAGKGPPNFLMPVRGQVVDSFGAKNGELHNDGINIAAPKGTAVLASKSGVVVYAGNEIRSFGNMILIQHANGWVTAYAHTDDLFVGKDDVVKRGQSIATVGSSGNVGTPQLHFQIRKDSQPVDPSPLLAHAN